MSPLLSTRRNVHPFPARMAPDIALGKIEKLTSQGDVVLDPMCGSGTVPRIAAQSDRRAIGCDIDPLAILMTRVACNPRWSTSLSDRATSLVHSLASVPEALPSWIALDPPTKQYVDYWFAPPQQRSLSQLALALRDRPGKDDPLRLALSRIIVTKDGGASLARDTSHSRPHRVRVENEFDVLEQFIVAARRIESAVTGYVGRRTRVRTSDARQLNVLSAGSVDLTVTSPPYLNAIDYLRGHRLSLVWLGWTVTRIRDLRAHAIGAERALERLRPGLLDCTHEIVPRMEELPRQDQNVLVRYTRDMDMLCRAIGRVTRPGGHLVFVVANSQLRGVPIHNSHFCKTSAIRHGFSFVEGSTRPLPQQHRYLPPPESASSALAGRMREESVLTFIKD